MLQNIDLMGFTQSPANDEERVYDSHFESDYKCILFVNTDFLHNSSINCNRENNCLEEKSCKELKRQ